MGHLSIPLNSRQLPCKKKAKIHPRASAGCAGTKLLSVSRWAPFVAHILRVFPLVLQSHPPVTGVLKWEILESALGCAPEGAPGNRGCSGECFRECSGKLGVLQGVLPRVLFLLTPHIEHSREHSLEHPQFP